MRLDQRLGGRCVPSISDGTLVRVRWTLTQKKAQHELLARCFYQSRSLPPKPARSRAERVPLATTAGKMATRLASIVAVLVLRARCLPGVVASHAGLIGK